MKLTLRLALSTLFLVPALTLMTGCGGSSNKAEIPATFEPLPTKGPVGIGGGGTKGPGVEIPKK